MNPNDQQPQQPAQPQQQAQPVFQMTPPQFAQAPAPDTNSFQQQPKVQYVVMQKSLEGLGGWLAFFMAIFVLSSIAYIGSTFKTPTGLHTVTDPLLAIGFISAVVLIALRKKAALWVAYATIALSFIVSVINNLITGKPSVGALISTIVISFVFYGLLALYFFVSKRVKATLTR